MSQVFAQRRTTMKPRMNYNKPLHDLGFSVLPLLDDKAGPVYCDGYVYVSVGCVLVTLLFRQPVNKQITRKVIIKRWALMLGLLFFIRGVCVFVTQLPQPDKEWYVCVWACMLGKSIGVYI